MRNVWVVVVVCVVAVELLLVLHLNWIIIEQARKKDRSFWLGKHFEMWRTCEQKDKKSYKNRSFV